MSGKIVDIYAEVGWKFDQVKLREVAKYIGDMNIASIISAGSLAALGIGIKDLIEDTSKLAVNIATLHSTTGIDTTFLLKFENASYELNSTKESADQLIASFSKMKAALMVPGGQLPFGLRMIGFTKKDFEGSLEENMRMVWTRLSQSKPPAGASQAIKEQWQGLLTSMAASFNVTPEQFMAMSNKEFGAKFALSPSLSPVELDKITQASTDWRTAVVDLNTDVQKLVPAFLQFTEPAIKLADALAKFVNKHDLPHKATEIMPLTMISKLIEIHNEKVKAGLELSFEDTVKKYKDEAVSQINIIKNAWNMSDKTAPAKIITVQMSPITVVTNDVTGFEKWFENNWKKMMIKTANQFGLGTT